MIDEEKGVDSDLIRGHIDTIILKVLKTGDRYGLEIIEDVLKASGGLYELKQPTLYSCLKRLESQNLISSYWTDSDIGGKRHYYKLTEEGSEVLAKNQNDWAKSRSIIESLIYEDVPKNAPQQINESPVNVSEAQNKNEVVLEEAQNDDVFGELENDVSDAEAAEIYSEYKEEQEEQKEITAQENTAEEEQEEQEEDSSAIEDELLAFNELEMQRKANEPTALELAAEGQPYEYDQDEENSTTDENSDIEFSTFDQEKDNENISLFDTQAEDVNYATKQDALDILFGSDEEPTKEETANETTEKEQENKEVENTNNIVEDPLPDKSIELSEIPVDPTYEQKQTLKMFEANSVNASLTDNGYKKRLTELSAYTINSAKIPEQKRNTIEYHPEDYNSINNRFKEWGISVRTHKKIEKPKEDKTHIFKNKINMVNSWITFGITTLLLIVSLAILAGAKAKYMTIQNALPLYLPFIVVLLLYPIIMTIIHSMDPNKRVVAKYAPRISIIASILFLIQALLITYAINLQTGFVSFAQKDYNHLGWIVPSISSLAIIIQSITYYVLYRSQKFHN